MNTYDVWIEGYLITGMGGIPAQAKKIGTVEAETFAAACDKVCLPIEWQKLNGYYDRQHGTVWGCRLFDNEADARKQFG